MCVFVCIYLCTDVFVYIYCVQYLCVYDGHCAAGWPIHLRAMAKRSRHE